MNADGSVNQKLRDNRKIDRSEMLKIKALDLESLIVERLTRDRLADAKRIFNVLRKLLINTFGWKDWFESYEFRWVSESVS